ncbi:GPI inositol-deacylase-like, partial [Homarus americanus]
KHVVSAVSLKEGRDRYLCNRPARFAVGCLNRAVNLRVNFIMAAEVKLVLAGLLSALLTCGIYEHVVNIEPNKCEMTYMYQLPQYIPIKLSAEVVERFPYYGVYAYGEGSYSDSLKKGLYTGIPVLFIPGNSGSHKQALDDETDFHFDFFTVDINEELGAFYGPALEKQTEFVSIAVNRILRLYGDAPVTPESLILVGHSMVNTYWTMERPFDLKDVVLVSIGGGRNDVQVPTSHTHTPLADIATTTSDVPSCWVTADHQAIVWCRQLVLAVVRALFDCIDPRTLMLTTNRKLIVDVFDYHLSKRITGKRYKSAFYPTTIEFDKEAEWKELPKRQHTHVAKATPHRTYLMIPINPGHQLYHQATIVATNLDSKIWVMACNANIGKLKTVELDMGTLGAAGHTHIIVHIPTTDEKVQVAIDIHSKNGRQRAIDVPAFFRSFMQTLIVDTTPQKALSYNVTLKGLQDMWQSFKIIVRPRSTCATENVPVAKMYTPWVQKESSLESSGPGISYIAELSIPPLDDNSSASIQFILNPECTYSILIQGSFIGVFRRLVWLYGSQVPTYCMIEKDGYCPSFFSSMLSLTPLAVVPFVKIGSLVLKNLEIIDDMVIMSNNGEDLPVLPILLFLGTLPLTLALGAAAWGLILLSGNAAHSFVVRILGHSLGGTDIVADLAVSGLSRVPMLVFKLYEDYIEKIVLGLIPGVSGDGSTTDRALSRVHFHLTLMMLVFLVTVINIPTLIIWSRLIRNNLQLSEDPTLMVTVAILVTLCFLWQKKLPQAKRKYYKELSYIIHSIAVIALLFGSVHIYRVSYLVVGALALVAFHQIVAPTPEDIQEQDHDSPSRSSQPYMAQVGTEDATASNGSHSETSTPGSDLSHDTVG